MPPPKDKMSPAKDKLCPTKDKTTLPKDQEVKELSSKDGIFLMHLLHNLLSNGAKIDWSAVAEATSYKNGPSAYMRLCRIKNRIKWPSDGAGPQVCDPVVTGSKRGAENMEPSGKTPVTKRSKAKSTNEETQDAGKEGMEEVNVKEEYEAVPKHVGDSQIGSWEIG